MMTKINPPRLRFTDEERDTDESCSEQVVKNVTDNIPRHLPTTTNPYSKYRQKKAIKHEYAKARRTSSDTAKASEVASKASKFAAEKSKEAVEFIVKNKKVFIIIGTIALVLLVFMSMISPCSVLVQGAAGSLGMTTYTASKEDIRNVESTYKSMENELQMMLNSYAALYPGYDSYIITGTVIGHDPFVLASILSAIYGDYTSEDAESMLNVIFSMQYAVTEEVTTIDGRTICSVSLNCTEMEEIAEILLTDEQYAQYEIYMTTSGNCPDIFTEH